MGIRKLAGARNGTYSAEVETGRRAKGLTNVQALEAEMQSYSRPLQLRPTGTPSIGEMPAPR